MKQLTQQALVALGLLVIIVFATLVTTIEKYTEAFMLILVATLLWLVFVVTLPRKKG